jgi:hypothetical protein
VEIPSSQTKHKYIFLFTEFTTLLNSSVFFLFKLTVGCYWSLVRCVIVFCSNVFFGRFKPFIMFYALILFSVSVFFVFVSFRTKNGGSVVPRLSGSSMPIDSFVSLFFSSKFYPNLLFKCLKNFWHDETFCLACTRTIIAVGRKKYLERLFVVFEPFCEQKREYVEF